jgi:hypothetical protein
MTVVSDLCIRVGSKAGAELADDVERVSLASHELTCTKSSPADFKTADMPPATDKVPPVTPWK